MASNEGNSIQDRLSALCKLVHVLHDKRTSSEPTVTAITRNHTRCQQEQRVTPYVKGKLKGLYSQAATEAAQEVHTLREALEQIYQIHTIRHARRFQAKQQGKETLRRGALMKLLHNDAQTLPLCVMRPTEEPPPLTGALPPDNDYIASPGELVACLVRSSPATDETTSWILATVTAWAPTVSRYEVEDIDEEQQETHTLSRRRVWPLPLQRSDPRIHPHALYQHHSTVLALYPQTTCFYKAVIQSVPKLPTDSYSVLFEDPSYPDGYSPALAVPQRYIIPYVKDKKNR